MKILRRLVVIFALSAALALPAKVVNAHRDDENNAKGDAAFARKDWATAVACYTEALKTVPYLNTYINRASAYIGLGKYDEAIADYDHAIAMNNEAIFSEIHMRYIRYNRALAYMESKQYEKAIDDFNYIIPKIDRAVEPFLGRGHCHLQLGQLKEARHDTQIALKVSPGHAQANIQMIYLYQKEGDVAAARQQLAKLVALMDKSSTARSYQDAAWFLASTADDEFRDSRRAVLYATKACELTKWQDFRAVDTLAVAYANAGDFPNAIKWEQDCLSRNDLTETKRHAAEARLAAFQHSVPYREAN